MVPDSERPPDPERPDDRPPGKTDGGTPAGFDQAVLYTVVRDAVKDALLDVIGTLLLVGIAFVLVATGAQVALQSASLLGVAIGAGIAAAGIYIAAATLELIPPIRDWF